jgi:sugar phosphate isomerase/epimerase
MLFTISPAPVSPDRPMDRRSFLQAISLPFAIPALSAIRGRADRLQRIGLQLYTVRDLMQADLARTLEQVAAVGYDEVEFAGYFNETPKRIRALLDKVGLAAPSAHASLADLTQHSERTFDAAEVMGHRYIVVPSLDPEERRSLDDYRRVAAALNRAGELAKAQGLRVAYHNHDFELAPIDGVRPYDLLLSETEPGLVSFEMDFYWITRGGGNPLAYFKGHPGRFHLCHLKDMDRRGEMADVGAGRIDFGKILQHRKAAGLRHFFVEHDHPADALVSVRASYKFLRSLEV